MSDDVPEDWEDIDTSDALSSTAPPPQPALFLASQLQEPEGDLSTQQYALAGGTSLPPPPSKPKKPTQPRPKEPKEPKPEVTTPLLDKEALLAKTLSGSDTLTVLDPLKTPLNVVFIGHVDAGKSTICGNLLLHVGKVDQRTKEKYEEEARMKGCENWWLPYIMDLTEEERTKGITIELGRAGFESPHKRITLLDAPGHRDFVPNMMAGAVQADCAALVVSARLGEFEAGFERGGQTQEHALLVRACGIQRLLVLINKMDSVDWSQERFHQVRTTLEPFLTDTCGLDVNLDVLWIPMSGLTGEGLHTKAQGKGWDCGEPLLGLLDRVELRPRPQGPLCIPVLDRYRDQGLWLLGKVECGQMIKGQEVQIQPSNLRAEVTDIYLASSYEENAPRLASAESGESLRFRLKVAEDVDILKGSIVTDPGRNYPATRQFRARLRLFDLLEHKPLITAGYQCVLHIHTAVLDCTILNIECVIDKVTHQRHKSPFGRSQSRVVVSLETGDSVSVAAYSERPWLGGFTLRDEGKTIAIGRVLSIP